jgi:hypothetical protein
MTVSLSLQITHEVFFSQTNSFLAIILQLPIPKTRLNLIPLLLNSCPGRLASRNLTLFYPAVCQSQSHIATDGQSISQSVSQSVSKSWCRAPSGAHDQIFITVWQLRSCFRVGALSDERTGLSFVYAAGPCQCSLSRVRVPFLRLLRLAGSRWRYSTPPPHGGSSCSMSKSKSKSHCDWRSVSQ